MRVEGDRPCAGPRNETAREGWLTRNRSWLSYRTGPPLTGHGLSGTHECSQPALSGHSQVWCSGSRMGPRSRLSTRDRPTGCEEETICAGRSAATHRRRRCSGLSELLAVSLDKARRPRAERLCAHAGHDVGGEVVDLVAIWTSR